MTEAEMLKLQQELVAMGVPRSAVARALKLVEEGGTAREAFDIFVDAVPEVDAALLLQVQAERLVLAVELAAKREKVAKPLEPHEVLRGTLQQIPLPGGAYAEKISFPNKES